MPCFFLVFHPYVGSGLIFLSFFAKHVAQVIIKQLFCWAQFAVDVFNLFTHKFLLTFCSY